MFDQLSDRLQSTLSDVRSRGKLAESDVDAAMREIRLALLEADDDGIEVLAMGARHDGDGEVIPGWWGVE